VTVSREEIELEAVQAENRRLQLKIEQQERQFNLAIRQRDEWRQATADADAEINKLTRRVRLLESAIQDLRQRVQL
jgi:predicted  nucleic acid-binding Zn-ribbon protein